MVADAEKYKVEDEKLRETVQVCKIYIQMCYKIEFKSLKDIKWKYINENSEENIFNLKFCYSVYFKESHK